MLYLSGFVIFAAVGLWVYYLEQWWIPLIVGGTSWVSLALTWFFSRYRKIFSDAMASFNIKSGQREKLLGTFSSRISDDSTIIIYSVPWIVIIISYILLAREVVVVIPLEIHESILTNPLLLAYSISLGTISAYHIGMGTYIIVKGNQFVRDICKFPLKTIPLEIRHRTGLHSLARFAFMSSISWFVDVGIATILVVTIVDIFTVATLAALTIIGLLILLLPQIYLRRSILRYKDDVQSQIIEKFRSKWDNLDENLGRVGLITLSELFNQVERIEEWPFGKGRTVQEALTAVLPLVTSIIGLILGGRA